MAKEAARWLPILILFFAACCLDVDNTILSFADYCLDVHPEAAVLMCSRLGSPMLSVPYTDGFIVACCPSALDFDCQPAAYDCTTLLQRAVSPDSSPDRLMEEGMPESTIQVAAPSYPAEFGNEAYRIAETMERTTAADANPYQGSSSADDYSYQSIGLADTQQPAQPQQYASR